MKKPIRFFINLICVLTILLLSFSSYGCGSTWKTEYLTHFNTPITITVKGVNLKGEVLNKIDTAFSQIDSAVSTSKNSSNIYAFNNMAVGETITFDDLSYTLTKKAIDFNKNVSGKFSPFIYPLIDLWQFTPDKFGGFFTIPTDQQIEDAKLLCSSNLIELSSGDKTIKKLGDTKLDLGGITKGYATDVAKEILTLYNVKEGYVSAGGSSIYVFSVPDYLAVSHPRQKNTQILKILPHIVKNKSVSTSGDYERFYSQNGKRYSHIIDPTTGRPIDTGFQSITVIGNDGAFCDMLSTALCCFSFEEMCDFISDNDFDVQIFAIYEKNGEKKILTNKKQGDDFTLLDNEYLVETI